MDQKLRSSLEIHHLVCGLPDRWIFLMLIYYKEFIDTSGNCGMSYAVTIVSPNFAKKITLQRHKLGELSLVN